MKSISPLLFGIALFVVAALLFRENRDARHATAESARLRATVDSLTAVGARIDTVYSRDTLRLWRQVRITDSLTQTVEVWKRDTLRVVEYVERADSTIRECRATVLTCEERVANRDARIETLTALNADTERRLTAVERRAKRDRLFWGAAGALAGWALKP